MEGLLQRGYAVAMPDYEGLGTAGVHTYMDRVSQGRATLDAVRAAQQLAGTGLSPHQPGRPPGLLAGRRRGGLGGRARRDVRAGAPAQGRGGRRRAGRARAPVATNLDGGPYSAFAFFALRGLAASYDIDLAPYLNDARAARRWTPVEQDCVFDLLDNAFVQLRDPQRRRPSRCPTLMTREPFRTVIAQPADRHHQADACPVLVSHSTLDDAIPYAVGKAMARSWCGKGANVRLLDQRRARSTWAASCRTPPRRQLFCEARFAGLPQLSNCWLL